MAGGIFPWTVAGAELSARFKSNPAPATLATFVINCGTVGTTTICTLAAAPTARLSRSQRTTPLSWEQLPWLDVAETKSTPAGRVSITATLVAAAGPRLVKMRGKVRVRVRDRKSGVEGKRG